MLKSILIASGQDLYKAIDSPVDKDLPGLVNTILNLLMWTVVIAAIAFLILNALKFVTSQGDASKAGEAQKGITYALIGIVVAVIGKVLVQFILAQLGVAGV